MKTNLQDFLIFQAYHQAFDSLTEDKLLGILTLLKKKLRLMLSESAGLENTKLYKYLKLVAIFEQFFRYASSKNIDLLDIPGFSRLVTSVDLDTANENEIEEEIDKIINTFFGSRISAFKNIVTRRFDDFTKWIHGNKKEDLEIISSAVDFTIKSIEQFNRAARRA